MIHHCFIKCILSRISLGVSSNGNYGIFFIHFYMTTREKMKTISHRIITFCLSNTFLKTFQINVMNDFNGCTSVAFHLLFILILFICDWKKIEMKTDFTCFSGKKNKNPVGMNWIVFMSLVSLLLNKYVLTSNDLTFFLFLHYQKENKIT